MENETEGMEHGEGGIGTREWEDIVRRMRGCNKQREGKLKIMRGFKQ
jgi:hypothetical protein